MIACAEDMNNFEKESDMCTNPWIKNELIFKFSSEEDVPPPD